jgi:hypothetical protein
VEVTRQEIFGNQIELPFTLFQDNLVRIGVVNRAGGAPARSQSRPSASRVPHPSRFCSGGKFKTAPALARAARTARHQVSPPPNSWATPPASLFICLPFTPSLDRREPRSTKPWVPQTSVFCSSGRYDRSQCAAQPSGWNCDIRKTYPRQAALVWGTHGYLSHPPIGSAPLRP